MLLLQSLYDTPFVNKHVGAITSSLAAHLKLSPHHFEKPIYTANLMAFKKNKADKNIRDFTLPLN